MSEMAPEPVIVYRIQWIGGTGRSSDPYRVETVESFDESTAERVQNAMRAYGHKHAVYHKTVLR